MRLLGFREERVSVSTVVAWGILGTVNLLFVIGCSEWPLELMTWGWFTWGSSICWLLCSHYSIFSLCSVIYSLFQRFTNFWTLNSLLNRSALRLSNLRSYSIITAALEFKFRGRIWTGSEVESFFSFNFLIIARADVWSFKSLGGLSFPALTVYTFRVKATIF